LVSFLEEDKRERRSKRRREEKRKLEGLK